MTGRNDPLENKRPDPPPGRGEIWLVDLNPTVGSEIQKTRPCVVISSDFMGKLPVKLVVPITEWNAIFRDNVWHVRIDPTPLNKLTKPGALDVIQLRAVDTARFKRKIGVCEADILVEASAAIAAVVEYE